MGEASGGVGNGVDGVGAVDAGVGEDAIGVGHGANGAVDQGGSASASLFLRHGTTAPRLLVQMPTLEEWVTPKGV